MIESEGAKDILTVILIIATSIKDLFALKGAYHTLVPFSSVEFTKPFSSQESFHPIPNSYCSYSKLGLLIKC